MGGQPVDILSDVVYRDSGEVGQTERVKNPGCLVVLASFPSTFHNPPDNPDYKPSSAPQTQTYAMSSTDATFVPATDEEVPAQGSKAHQEGNQESILMSEHSAAMKAKIEDWCDASNNLSEVIIMLERHVKLTLRVTVAVGALWKQALGEADSEITEPKIVTNIVTKDVKPVDPKLEPFFVHCRNLLEEVTKIAESFEGHIFFLALTRPYSQEDLTAEDKLWFDNLRIFECHLKAICLSQDTSALKAHLDVNAQDDRVTQAESIKAISELPGLGEWSETKREAVRLSAQLYKRILARYFTARIEENLVWAAKPEGEASRTLDSGVDGVQGGVGRLFNSLALWRTIFLNTLKRCLDGDSDVEWWSNRLDMLRAAVDLLEK